MRRGALGGTWYGFCERTYDGAGNRTSETTDGLTTTWDLDAQGWPLRSDNATPGVTTDDTTYGWDRAGNLTSVDAPGTAGYQSFTLDAFDRITNATLGGVSVGYTFDAFARTITRTQGSVTTTFAYEGISEILARSVTGTTATTYAHTPGGPLGERSGTATPQLYLRDLHSDIVATVDPTSTTPLSRAYSTPWGEPTWEDGTSALGFQSQYTDPGSGFVDMTTRSYVPSLGRFASQDIVFGGFRHPLSLNQWIYGNDDPVTSWDPDGTLPTRETGAGGGGGAVVVVILTWLSSTEAAVIGSTIVVGGCVVACGQVAETLEPAVEVFLQRTFSVVRASTTTFARWIRHRRSRTCSNSSRRSERTPRQRTSPRRAG
jgi:RHS repeat-associated protein